MSRQVNVNNPESWDEDDRTYLRSRIETVPVEHRHVLDSTLPVPPEAVTQPTQLTRLSLVLAERFPGEMRESEDVVDTAIRLLSATAEGEQFEDDYDEWKPAELRAEAAKRDGLTIRVGATKADMINALRNWDAAHPGE